MMIFHFQGGYCVHIPSKIFGWCLIFIKRPQMWFFKHNYFLNLMWIITLFDFEMLFFVIIFCKPMLLCYVWDGNLWILLFVGCINVVSQVILIMAVLWKRMLHFVIFKFCKILNESHAYGKWRPIVIYINKMKP